LDRLHLRQATPDDIEILQSLEKNGNFDIPVRSKWNWLNQYVAYTDREILEGVYLADLDGEIVGYTIINKVIDRHHIQETVLHSDYHGQGLGNEIMKFGAEFGNVWCEVKVDNEPSIKMALRQGFIKHSYVRNFYRDGCDAVIMVSKDWQSY